MNQFKKKHFLVPQLISVKLKFIEFLVAFYKVFFWLQFVNLVLIFLLVLLLFVVAITIKKNEGVMTIMINDFSVHYTKTFHDLFFFLHTHSLSLTTNTLN